MIKEGGENFPEQECEETLQEKSERIFNTLQSEEGKEMLAHGAVFRGIVLKPEFIELALRYEEKFAGSGKLQEVAAGIIEKFEPFEISEDRKVQIQHNIEAYTQQFATAEEEFKLFEEEKKGEIWSG